MVGKQESDNVCRRLLAYVASGYSLGDIAENLVGRAVGEARVFEGVYAKAVGDAEEDDFIPDRNAGDTGHVDERQIHRDAAQDRRVVVAYDDAAAIGELAVVTVRIADRKHCHMRRTSGDIGSAVAQRLIRSEIAQRQ